MLVPMLGLDGIACRCRFARKGNVAFVIPARIYRGPALPLLPGSIGVTGGLPASVSARAAIQWRPFELILLRLPATAHSQMREHAAAVALLRKCSLGSAGRAIPRLHPLS